MFPDVERFEPSTAYAYAPTWRDQAGECVTAEYEVVARTNCIGVGEKKGFDFVILNFRGSNHSLFIQPEVMMHVGDRLRIKRTDADNVVAEIVLSHGPGKPVAYGIYRKLPNGDIEGLWARTSVAYEYDAKTREWTLLRYDSHPVNEPSQSTAT